MLKSTAPLHRRLIWLLMGLTLTSCLSDQNSKEASKEFSEGSLYSYEKGTPIPDQLVTLIEQKYIEVFREENPEVQLSDAQIAVSVPRRLLELDVQLWQKNQGTLSANTSFVLPAGGATIDLADYVNKGKGIFFLKILPKLGKYDLKGSKVEVFYVSNSKKFEVHKKRFGSGCGKFMEISKFYHSQIATKGYELAATAGRYLGQVLGSFYFVVVNVSGVYVGSVSFVDTRYKKLHCLPPESISAS